LGEKRSSNKKEVQIRSSNPNLNLSILHQLEQGIRPIQIARELNISKSNLQYYLNKLKKIGKIKKKGYGVWEVQKEVQINFVRDEGDICTSSITNLHALQINIPILSGKIKGADWKIGEKLKNWLPKYKGLTNLGGLTLKNNNNKSITIFAKSRNIEKLEEIDNLTFKIRAFAHDFFKKKYGVVLDVMNAQVKNLNIATQDKNSEDMIKKGEKFELDLNKQAEKILPKDNIKGKSWIDGSPFKFTAETNDKEWKRAYLQMPLMMKQIAQATHYISQNYASHVRLVEKASKVMEKLDKRLSQTKLSEFI